MKMNEDAFRRAAERFLEDRLDAIDSEEKGRVVLDALLTHLADLGSGPEDTFGIHLAAEEAIMKRFRAPS